MTGMEGQWDWGGGGGACHRLPHTCTSVFNTRIRIQLATLLIFGDPLINPKKVQIFLRGRQGGCRKVAWGWQAKLRNLRKLTPRPPADATSSTHNLIHFAGSRDQFLRLHTEQYTTIQLLLSLLCSQHKVSASDLRMSDLNAGTPRVFIARHGRHLFIHPLYKS